MSVNLYHGLKLVLSKIIRNGNTKYHIECSYYMVGISQTYLKLVMGHINRYVHEQNRKLLQYEMLFAWVRKHMKVGGKLETLSTWVSEW